MSRSIFFLVVVVFSSTLIKSQVTSQDLEGRWMVNDTINSHRYFHVELDFKDNKFSEYINGELTLDFIYVLKDSNNSTYIYFNRPGADWKEAYPHKLILTENCLSISLYYYMKPEYFLSEKDSIYFIKDFRMKPD